MRPVNHIRLPSQDYFEDLQQVSSISSTRSSTSTAFSEALGTPPLPASAFESVYEIDYHIEGMSSESESCGSLYAENCQPKSPIFGEFGQQLFRSNSTGRRPEKGRRSSWDERIDEYEHRMSAVRSKDGVLPPPLRSSTSHRRSISPQPNLLTSAMIHTHTLSPQGCGETNSPQRKVHFVEPLAQRPRHKERTFDLPRVGESRRRLTVVKEKGSKEAITSLAIMFA